MRKSFLFLLLAISCQLAAQDSTEVATEVEEKKPVKIFQSDRVINANTTETAGRGVMQFKVTHYFDDIDGAGGVFGRFLGLDNSKDIRIGFHIGLTDKLDINIARIKGAAAVNKMYELAVKYKFMNQVENDPGHPFALALFANMVVSSQKASALPNFENSFRSFSDRLSQVVQLIIARKFGKVSLQLNPTFVHTNHVILNDDQSMFALGGALRVPITNSINLLVDYFHPFRSESSKDYFKIEDDAYDPPNDITFNPNPITFYDPLGIGVEVTTAGHVFNLNFNNATEILENRFIPRTISKWSKGQFRWCFTISRRFVLWR